ncbi:hypothetical protein M431DRAFT_372207 [Trichoderma harzianum CBS 226.95]|uniref:Uncharacterized protein n=1 Tax=Trichoderma harzianum CBS 226.95 TaxID=983964 RepID=A0A2T4AGS5_TRIHA|nr:hypothetical protein M431DRAFT_372207 [Trichoderma harzianum CBS 226.95]PTB56291.1 hypothetical protein M431DRAFT_372207 [Trichoderma harzianum CBS 226.95]
MLYITLNSSLTILLTPMADWVSLDGARAVITQKVETPNSRHGWMHLYPITGLPATLARPPTTGKNNKAQIDTIIQ